MNTFQKMDSLIKQIFSAGCQTGHKQYKALFLGGKMSMIPLHVMHLLSAKQYFFYFHKELMFSVRFFFGLQ